MPRAGGATTIQNIIVAADDSALKNLIAIAQNANAALRGIGSGISFKGISDGIKDAKNKIQEFSQTAFDAASALVGLASEGAKIQQLSSAFNALGGSGQELARLKELTGGLVSDADLMQAANLAKLFNLPKEELPALIKLAQGASVALGTTVGKALSDTFTAASRQSKMIADNMGIVMGDMEKAQADYAKKIGVSVDSLNDKQKQLVFVQKMIAEGGRQVELAGLSQNNQFAKGEVALQNFTDSMKVMIAESFVSSGAMDAMMGVFTQVQSVFQDNSGAIMGALMPAFKALVGIVPPVLQVFGALLPLIENLAPLLTMVGSIVTAVAPIIGGLALVLGKVLGVAIDLVQIGLWGLMSALELVIGLVSDDLAAGFTRAREQIEGLTQAANDDSEALGGLGGAAASMAAANSDAETSTVTLGAALKSLQVQAIATANDIARAFNPSAFPVAATVGNVQKLEEAFKKIKPEELLARMEKLSEAKNFIKTPEEAIKALSQQITLEFAAANGIVGEETRALYDHANQMIHASMGNQTKAQVDLQLEAFRAVGDIQKMEEDRLAFGVSVMGELAMQGVKTKVDAMQKLEEEFNRIESAISASAVYDEAQKGTELERLANEYNFAADAIDAEFEKKAAEKAKSRGGGGGRDDSARLILQAQLSLMEDHERKAAEVRQKYGDMAAKLPKDHAELKSALLKQGEIEIAKAEDERLAKIKADEMDLTYFLMGERERRFAQAISAAEQEAAAMRALVSPTDMGGLAGVEQQKQAMLEQARAAAAADSPLWQGMESMGQALGGGVVDSITAVGDAMAEMDRKSMESAMIWAGAFQGAGQSIGDAFAQVAIAGADMREQSFKMMGGLFGQLSTAFLAWATAEGSLLAGNPFGAAAAAIALGVVASAISAFGSRGKGGGGGGATGATSARSVMDRRRDEGERAPQVVNYNYGFSTPDEISKAADRAGKRGNDLRGREKAA